MNQDASKVQDFGLVSSQLDEVASSRGELGELARSVCAVARQCLDFLASHKDQNEKKRGPESMQLFGGFFQAPKLPFDPIFQVEPAPLLPEDILKESGLLFSSTLQSISLGKVPLDNRQSISQTARRLADQVSQSRVKAVAEIQIRIDKLGEQIKEMDDLARTEKINQERIAEKRTSNASALERIRQLKIQLETLTSELQATQAEEDELKGKVGGLRQRKKELDDTRAEVKSLSQAVEAGEKEVNDLRKRKVGLELKKVEISENMAFTKKMLEDAEKTVDTTILEKIKEIWNQLPKDQFDNNRK